MRSNIESMFRNKILIVIAVVALFAATGLGYIFRDTLPEESLLIQKQSEKTLNADSENRLKNLENVEVRLRKQEKMKDLNAVLTPEGIVNGIYQSLFVYENDIDPEVRDDMCIAWKGSGPVAFGSTGAWEASTIRSELLPIKMDAALIDIFFRKNGFARNEENDANVFETHEVYGEVTAYERNDLKCLVSWDSGMPYSDEARKIGFSVGCTKIDIKAKTDFADIYPSFSRYLPPEGERGIGELERFCIYKKNESFAHGSVGSISAPNWYARKRDGKWIMEHITQDYPLCERVEEFPLDYFDGECYFTDETGELKVKDFIPEPGEINP